MASINELTGDLEGEADWDLAILTEGSGLGSQASIHGDYGLLGEACSVVSHSLPSSVADLRSLTIRSGEPMRRASNLKELDSALDSPLSSNNTHILELESQRASKSFKADLAVVELESTKRPLRFVKDAVSIMLDQVQSQEP